MLQVRQFNFKPIYYCKMWPAEQKADTSHNYWIWVRGDFIPVLVNSQLNPDYCTNVVSQGACTVSYWIMKPDSATIEMQYVTMNGLVHIFHIAETKNKLSLRIKTALFSNLWYFFPLAKGSVRVLVPSKARNRPTAWSSLNCTQQWPLNCACAVAVYFLDATKIRVVYNKSIIWWLRR